MVGPYEKESKRFIKVAYWLSEEDELMVLHLKTCARALDKQMEDNGSIQSAMAAQFRLILNDLEARKPKNDDNQNDDEGVEFA